jgi:hypothetical protein
MQIHPILPYPTSDPSFQAQGVGFLLEIKLWLFGGMKAVLQGCCDGLVDCDVA